MLFNSLEFLLFFLPLTWMLWRIAVERSEGLAIWVLLIASLIYYAAWEPRNLLVLAPLGILTFTLGKMVGRYQSRLAMQVIIVANLCALFWFKYSHFVSDSIHEFFPAFPVVSLGIALPLGISFFVFQKIALAVDLYQGRAKIDRADRFSLFVLFFPQLIAGPIVHYRQLAPQLTRKGMLAASDPARGLFVFATGLCMKTLIADTLSSYVAAVFDHVDKINTLDSWIGVLAYTMQLYFDFAGYGAMAVGMALMFGIHLPWNFNSPYKSDSIVDFWQRWHISLSEFLRDYLYIPLGGNRRGKSRQYLNLLITMLLGGLWHGAGWNFIFWGGLHGLYICICHASRGAGLRLPRLLSKALTLAAVMFAWIFFRAPDFHSAKVIIKRLFLLQPDALPADFFANIPSQIVLMTLLAAWLLALLAPNVREIAARLDWEKGRLATMVAATLLFVGLVRQLYTGDIHEFIYFRF